MGDTPEALCGRVLTEEARGGLSIVLMRVIGVAGSAVNA